MAEYKYSYMVQGMPSWNPESWPLKNDYLRNALRVFTFNLARTANLAAMPAMVAFMARRDAIFIGNANFRTTGKGEWTMQEMMKFQFTPDVEVELKRQLADYEAIPAAEQETFRKQFGAQFVVAALTYLNGMQISMDAIYASVVLESWTAFESLSADLWVVALDKGPRQLANAVALSGDLKKPDETITPKVLLDLDYDVRAHMGSFLRDTGRVSFQSLKEIQKSYAIAFGKKANDQFSLDNSGYIIALSAFRNVLAHKAGKADRQFTTQMQSFPEFVTIQKNDMIFLDGEIVSKLREASVKMGFALIGFIDDYISALPN